MGHRWEDVKRSQDDPERAARVEARVRAELRAESPSCPACASAMVYETRPDVLTYKGRERSVNTLGWWCTQCAEAIFTGEPLAANERAYLELKAEVDGPQ
jgi:YgiT-type zinc finger domain-containing protein